MAVKIFLVILNFVVRLLSREMSRCLKKDVEDEHKEKLDKYLDIIIQT